ncbi:carbon storage regulator CsrA [Bacillus sp. JJ722]|uniref:carbon storage regulator CsrA n=1 Tax=Bacillus sp. JJ722 TaxID=3122973 RepID=UPI002FFD67D3
MLVLTRKVGESIIIGEQIELTVVEVKGDQIKLGIAAPKDIEIHRKEIYENIRNENKNALNNVSNIEKILGIKE